MILENGVIRTLDPSLPTVRALAIAGDRIAGGVGTHETALPPPDVVDLGGRCVVPGFTDAHVHFPSGRWRSTQVRLEGARLARGGGCTRCGCRGRDVAGTLDPRHRLAERRVAAVVEPTKESLDAVTGDRPAALMARDGHSLWLNSAALAHADGDLAVPGGVVETDAHGEPTGVLREESAWEFRGDSCSTHRRGRTSRGDARRASASRPRAA